MQHIKCMKSLREKGSKPPPLMHGVATLRVCCHPKGACSAIHAAGKMKSATFSICKGSLNAVFAFRTSNDVERPCASLSGPLDSLLTEHRCELFEQTCHSASSSVCEIGSGKKPPA
jgi:hypothetical protein